MGDAWRVVVVYQGEHVMRVIGTEIWLDWLLMFLLCYYVGISFNIVVFSGVGVDFLG